MELSRDEHNTRPLRGDPAKFADRDILAVHGTSVRACQVAWPCDFPVTVAVLVTCNCELRRRDRSVVLGDARPAAVTIAGWR